MYKRLGVVLSIATVVLVAVVAWGLADSSPTICDGVNRELGGCSPDQPRFSAADCDGIAAEVGQLIDRRGLEIVREGATAELSLAGRLSNDRTLVFVRASQWMQVNAIRCPDTEGLVEGVVEQFSAEYGAAAVEHLYDDGDWGRDDLRRDVAENVELLRWWKN